MEKPRLTKSEINKYAWYQLLISFGSMLSMTYVTNYGTINLGLGAAMAGTALLVARAIDFIVSLVAGGIIAKSKMRWGKYSSWVVILRWVAAAGIVIQFTGITSLPVITRVVILILGYCFLHSSMDFIATSQYGILSVMAGPSMDDRNLLSIKSVQYMVISTIIVSLCTLPAVQFLTPYTGANMGYTIVAAIYALLFILGTSILINAAKPYDIFESSKGPVVTVKDMISSVVANSQLLFVILSYTLLYIGIYIGSAIIYFFFAFIMGNELLMSVSMTIITVFGLAASRIGPKIGTKLGKKRAMVFGMLVYGAGALCITLFGNISIYAYIIISCLMSVGMYMFTSFGVIYMLDAGEYGLWKTGKDNRAVAMSMMNIPMKIGMALGGAIGSYGLAAIGFDSFMAGAVPLADFSTKFMWLLGGVPAIFYVLGALVMAFGYKITDVDAARYAKENAERLAAKAVNQ